VSGQRHALTALYSGKIPVSIRIDVGSASQPVWTCLEMKQFPKGIRTPVQVRREVKAALFYFRSIFSSLEHI